MPADCIVIVKVVDDTGSILRYEDEQGNILAELEEDNVFNTQRLTITRFGIDSCYMLINGRIVKR